MLRSPVISFSRGIEMIDEKDRGWLKVPGIREKGDRSLEEQMLGLEGALREAEGKTVLDIGCAEGLIGREFAKAGAVEVLGIEVLETHLAVARKACADFSQMRFIQAELSDWAKRHPEPRKFDIVLALSIIHKLSDPNVGMRYAARSSNDLVCFRAPIWSSDGIVGSKRNTGRTCNVPQLMTLEGFVEEGTFKSGRGETVQYWRRIR